MKPHLRHAVMLVALAGCPRQAPPPFDATAPRDAVTDARGALLELGTGQSYWLDLPPDGARAELIHGPQGGYHIFGRVRFRGLVPEVSVAFRVTREDGGAQLTGDESSRRSEGRGLLRVGEDYESSVATLVILTQIRGPGEVVGQRVTLTATVTETAAGGRSLTASRVITVVDEDP